MQAKEENQLEASAAMPFKFISIEERDFIMKCLFEVDLNHHIGAVAQQFLIDFLYNRPKMLSERVPDLYGHPPLLFYFSLSAGARSIITGQPPLYKYITAEALNYTHTNQEILISNFTFEAASARFLGDEMICNKIDVSLFNVESDRSHPSTAQLLLARCPSALRQGQPLEKIADINLLFKRSYRSEMIHRLKDPDFYQLLLQYPSLRARLCDNGNYSYELSKEFDQYRYGQLKSLLDSDLKLAAELAKKQQDETKAAAEIDKHIASKEQSLLQKLGGFFKVATDEEQAGYKPVPSEHTIN